MRSVLNVPESLPAGWKRISHDQIAEVDVAGVGFDLDALNVFKARGQASLARFNTQSNHVTGNGHFRRKSNGNSVTGSDRSLNGGDQRHFIASGRCYFTVGLRFGFGLR